MVSLNFLHNFEIVHSGSTPQNLIFGDNTDNSDDIYFTVKKQQKESKVVGLFPTLPFSKHPGKQNFDSLKGALKKYYNLPENSSLKPMLISEIEYGFQSMLQYVGTHNQFITEEYYNALMNKNYCEAFIILTGIYEKCSDSSYTLPDIFSSKKTFLIADLDINKISFTCGGKNKQSKNICDLIAVLKGSKSFLNIIGQANKCYQFPDFNMYGRKIDYKGGILIPECLVDTSLLLDICPKSELDLADALMSIGVSEDVVKKIKELLLSPCPYGILFGKIALVASFYEALFQLQISNGTEYVAVNGTLTETIYTTYTSKTNPLKDDFLSIMGKIWFGSVIDKLSNSV